MSLATLRPQPRCRPIDRVIVIAASAGGLPPLRQIVAALPSRSRASIFIVMHIGPNLSVLPSLLSLTGKLPCRFATDLSLIEKGRIYVAPPDRNPTPRQGVGSTEPRFGGQFGVPGFRSLISMRSNENRAKLGNYLRYTDRLPVE